MRIGIAIVHFGEQSVLDDCIRSLTDEHCGEVNSNFSIEIFDCNHENIGFSRANNRIIKQYLRSNDKFDWIWLLNNDTKVLPETIKAIEVNLPLMPKDVGIIGFKVLAMDNPDFIHHAGTIKCIPFGIHKSGSVKLKQYQIRTEEKWVSFPSVLIRREVFEDIGLLDPKMFNICSDSDFCYRARYWGWKVVYEPTFVILHKIGSSAKPSPEQQKIMMADTWVFQNKWLNGKRFHDLDTELMQ